MLPLLAALFLVVPVLELAVLIAVGREIGVWWTILLVILVSIAGAWLARREGTAAWRRFQRALAEGRMPTSEVADGAMILLAGALLLTPGFLTDVLAVALLIRPIRAVVRRVVVQALVDRSLRRAGLGGAAPRRRPRIIDGSARISDPGFDDLGPSSTRVRWGTPEPDGERADDREPPPASSR